MQDLRVAIVGYGLAGRFFHAPLIASTPGMQVSSIVTANQERRRQATAEHPQARTIDDVDALWDHETPDLVVVATPNSAHAALARAAIERRVAVVVDKPLAVTADDAAAVVEAAELAGVLLTVFQNRRWDTDQLTFKRLASEGALGEVQRFESRFERFRPHADPAKWRETAPAQDGGGVLLDLGSHLVDQALVLFGAATDVYGEVAARRGTPGDDDAFIALHHAGGTISHLHASAVSPAPGPRLRVEGTEAAFVVPNVDPQEAALRAGARPDATDGWGIPAEWERGRLVAGESSVPVPPEPGDWPRFYLLLRDALREGGPPPVDPRDAVATLRVLEAARRSAAERSLVRVPSPDARRHPPDGA